MATFDDAHLPYCHCVKVGTLGFTSFDRDLLIDGTTYKASGAIDPTSINLDNEGGKSDFQVKGFIRSDVFTDIDIRSGRYENEDVEVFIANYLTRQKVKMLVKGKWGKVEQNGLTWRMTVHTNLDRLDDTLNNVIQEKCRYTGRLDNPRCGLDKYDFGVLGNITQVVDKGHFVINQSISPVHIFNWSSGGGYIEVKSGDNIGMKIDINYVETNGHVRLLRNPPYNWNVGDEIQLVPGCDGSFWVCGAIFNNKQRWGGFTVNNKWLPNASDLKR